MKEKIDLKHIISEPLGRKWGWYRKMSDYHEKVHPAVTLANGLAIVSLAVASACNAQELSSPQPFNPSEPIPTQPAPGDLGEIIENPTASAESALERVTGTFSEVSPYSLESVKNQYPELKDKNVSTFGIKINQNLFEYATTADVDPKESWAVISGNIVVQGQQIIADQMTIQDEKLFLKDNTGNWRELVKVRIEGQGALPDVFAWYLFDQRPNPNGTINLSLTKSVLAYPALSEEEWIKQTSGPTRDRPVMIMWAPWQPKYPYPRWETDYAVIPIISYQSIPGGAKDALVVSQKPQMTATPEPTSIPEAPSLPENLGGNTKYAEEIMEEGYAWEYNTDRTRLSVEWEKGSGNFELTARQVNGEWRVDENCKFVYIPEGASDITGNETLPHSKWSKAAGKNEHFGTINGVPDRGFVDFISTGKIIQNSRYDFETGAKLPGQIFYIEAFTQKRDGTPIKINIAVAIDMGDGTNILRPGTEDPYHEIQSIFEYAKQFGPGKKMTTWFGIGGGGKGSYYEYIKPLRSDARKFIGGANPPLIIMPSSPFESL